jgi:hypothetical protein
MAYACAPGHRFDDTITQAYSGFNVELSFVDHAGKPAISAHRSFNARSQARTRQTIVILKGVQKRGADLGLNSSLLLFFFLVFGSLLGRIGIDPLAAALGEHSLAVVDPARERGIDKLLSRLGLKLLVGDECLSACNTI